MQAKTLLTLLFLQAMVVRVISVLPVTLLNTTMPYVRERMATVYDGDDSIYLIGGYDVNFALTVNISRFSVSTQTIEVLDVQLPQKGRGSACIDGNGDIYFFANELRYTGDDLFWYTDVYKVPTNGGNSSTELVEQIYSDGYALCDKKDGIYMVDSSSGVLRYHSDTRTIERVLNRTRAIKPKAAAAWDDVSNNGYVFGGHFDSVTFKHIVKFSPGDLDNGVEPLVEILEPKLPERTMEGMAIFDGKYLFASVGEGYFYNTLYRLDPVTMEVETFFTAGGPADRFFNAGVTYVPKTNSIYVFGGFNFRALDTIYVINLDGAN